VNELRLDILGTSFSITADEDEDYLQEILAQFRKAIENTQNISGITEPINVAILTGYLLCDEVNRMKQMLEAESLKFEELALGLISKLEKIDKMEAL
jgi:cell division protein ZapA (FtsZ GTPase activity inhibitor)